MEASKSCESLNTGQNLALDLAYAKSTGTEGVVVAGLQCLECQHMETDVTSLF